MKEIKLEFHSHTYASKDCLVKPTDLVAECRRKGIDKIVVTDHNTISGALEAKQLAPDLIIVGEEINTQGGELLCAFLTEEIPAGLAPHDAIARLREQGAFISVSHPFDATRQPWFEAGLHEIRSEIDAIEIFNSRTFSQRANERAHDYASKWEIAGTVGSDAHTLHEIGTSTMILPEFSNAEELRKSIKETRFSTQQSGAHVRLASRYAALMKKIWII